MELTTNQKGAIAETAITAHATRLGIRVYRPLEEGGRDDLIFDVGGRLLRVQCKWVNRHGDVIKVVSYSSRRAAEGLRRMKYGPNDFDWLVAYCQELDKCYVLPIELCADRAGFHLRLGPTKNNQAEAILWAHDYELGAIAQLEERCHGMAEVVGSSPTSSTPPGPSAIGADELRLRLGTYLARVGAGEEFTINHRGRPRARLIPAEDAAASGPRTLENVRPLF